MSATTAADRSFLISACRLMMLYGVTAYELEQHLDGTIRALELEAIFTIQPGATIVVFKSPEETCIIKANSGLKLAKYWRVLEVLNKVEDMFWVSASGSLELEMIEEEKGFPVWMVLLAWGLGSASFCLAWFSGSWWDTFPAFALGIVGGIMQVLVPDWWWGVVPAEFWSIILTTFLARWFASIGDGAWFSFPPLIMASLVQSLPGLAIYNAASCLLRPSFSNVGSAGLSNVLYNLARLGFALATGSAIYGYFDVSAISFAVLSPASALANFVSVPIFIGTTLVICQTSWSLWPNLNMFFLATIAWTVTFFSGKFVGGYPLPVTSFFASFTVSLLARLVERYVEKWGTITDIGQSRPHGRFATPARLAILPAIFLLVPGGLSFRHTLQWAVQSADALTKGPGHVPAIYVDTAFAAVIVGISLSVGVEFGLAVGSVPAGWARARAERDIPLLPM